MKITVRNRLPILIRERKLRSASEFGRRLSEVGFPLSSAQASRYMKDDPPPFTLAFVEHACNVLDCLPNELFELTVELAAGEELDPSIALPRSAIVKTVAVERPTATSVSLKPSKAAGPSDLDLTGPKVSTFPKRKN